MHRCAVEVASREGLAEGQALASPGLLGRLGLAAESACGIRFGTRRAQAQFRVVPELPGDRLILSSGLAGRLCLEGPLRLIAAAAGEGELVLGPLVGLLISGQKLAAVLAGTVDTIYCRYARVAREAGAILCFFSAADVDPEAGTVRGYLLQDGEGGWVAGRFPFPQVIYDRCFGQTGRGEAARVRQMADRLGARVVNRPVKITKLQAFEVLAASAELAPHLPYTVPLTPESLVAALDAYPDIYLKPNSLYKGKGVYRLTRQARGWLLHSQEEGQTARYLSDREAVGKVLAPLVEQGDYVLQEGLDLATYLGNRFDFRSLVQKDGGGQWRVTGLVARIAPVGGTITSPRSGGQVAQPERVLRSAFPARWRAVLQHLEEVSVRLAGKVDGTLGPCVELGLDVGVLQDGSVKLIEVNGKPLRVSLQRLRDPLVAERIHRYPIHCAAAMDLGTARPAETGGPLPVPAVQAAAAAGSRLHATPLVGVLLGRRALGRLLGGQDARYRQMAAEARAAGALICFFGLDGIDRQAGRVDGWVERGGVWTGARLPLPDVIYNRATYSRPARRAAARALLRHLTDRDGVTLINETNAFGKWEVYQALRFFAATEHLAPETIRFGDAASLAGMLTRHGRAFIKADYGSHGADVLRAEAAGGRWQVRGQCRGRQVAESFASPEELYSFLRLLKGRRNWVVQQGVDLPEVEGRIFDLRAIAQKDGDGEWTVPLVLVRWAQPGQVTTNTSRGAEPLLPGAFLARAGQGRPELAGLEAAAAEAARQTAVALEARFGRLGEVGVDIGLDRAGRAWVLEANSKPFHRRLPGMRVPLVRSPIRYAVHLAARKREGRESGLAWL